MRVLATLPGAGTFQTGEAGEILVGRLVANASFVEALVRHGSFEEVCFFVGEARDEEIISRALVDERRVDAARLRFRSLLELPTALQAGDLTVLHQLSHADAFAHLVWLRDRYAATRLPVTAQVHSLSYPRLMRSYAAILMHPPGATDAIFCSSAAGRRVVEASFALAGAACARSFGSAPGLGAELPVVPLGVDADALASGDRRRGRNRLGLPANALVVLLVGRFSEHDKADLLPAVQAFGDATTRSPQPRRPLHLVVAGARQGSDAPETLARRASALGLDERVSVVVDFARQDLPDLLAAGDIFLAPSDSVQETFGLSPVEAMAAGLPVIASDLDGFKDTVTDDVGIRVPARWAADPGLLTDLGPVLYERPLHLLLGQSIEVDIGAMAEAIHGLALDDARREAMGRAARARARTVYDWRAVVPEYEAVWRRLAAGSPGSRPNSGAPSPLAMDFGALFGSYGSGRVDPVRLVVRTPLARRLLAEGNRYPIFVGLAPVFGEADVDAALSEAAEPVTLEALARRLTSRWPRAEAWRADLLVAWLLKHGLVG